MPETKGIMLYHDDMEAALAFLTDEELGELTRALLSYSRHNAVPDFKSEKVAMTWMLGKFAATIDRDKAKYFKSLEQRKEAVNKRWERERHNQDNPLHLSESNADSAESDTDVIRSYTDVIRSYTDASPRISSVIRTDTNNKELSTNNKELSTNNKELSTNNKVLSTNRKESSSTAACAVRSDFDLFWDAYPKKRNKAQAQKAFTAASKVTTLEIMLNAVESQRHTVSWIKDNGQFIPYPATWLNAHAWEDEVAAPAAEVVYTKDEDTL